MLHEPSTPPGLDGRPKDRPQFRVLVVSSSRFGNTRRVARALAAGLGRDPAFAVDCRSIDEVEPNDVERYDVLAVGGPTEVFSASTPMKQFLSRLRDGTLDGKHAFAFDTRLSGRLSGSAGRFIEERLGRLGARMIRPHASAIVRPMTREERARYGDVGAPEWARRLGHSGEPQPPAPPPQLDLLEPGSEVAFERIGLELGAALRTGLAVV